MQQKMTSGLPQSPVVKTPCFQRKECGFNPWLGNLDLVCHVARPKKKKKKGKKTTPAPLFSFPLTKPTSSLSTTVWTISGGISRDC